MRKALPRPMFGVGIVSALTTSIEFLESVRLTRFHGAIRSKTISCVDRFRIASSTHGLDDEAPCTFTISEAPSEPSGRATPRIAVALSKEAIAIAEAILIGRVRAKISKPPLGNAEPVAL